MNYNKTFLLGRLTADSRIDGNRATFSIAVNKIYTNKKGERQEESQFFNIVCNGKITIGAANRLKKGDTVFIEGEIRLRTWEEGGETKKTIQVVAENIQF